MKIVSFNVNGLRARIHQVAALVEKHRPDIIGLQETKVTDGEFPHEALREFGYHVAFHGQKGHYGVALLSKMEPDSVLKGFPADPADAQRRLIVADYLLPSGRRLRLLNGYFPQGESREHPVKFPAKQRFYADLMDFLRRESSPEDALVVMGDFNVSTTDADIGIGPDNARRWLRTGKCSFLPEERAWMADLRGWGLVDTFRTLFPEEERYSWFDYRSRGFAATPRRGLRIDLILATGALNEACVDAGIDYDIRGMEKPSDHCPIWSTFDF